MHSQQRSQWRRALVDGAMHSTPLNLAVIPWGFLAGSMAVDAGLTFWESIAMSAIVFAGAAQLVTLGLLNSGAGYITIIISVFFITSQHLLYGLTMRPHVKNFTTAERLSIGFLLTDELFAISAAKRQELSFPYLFGAGFSFYLVWQITSLCGIIMANSITDLSSLHLDFSVVATLLAIVVPLTKKISTACGVAFSLIVAVILSLYSISSAIDGNPVMTTHWLSNEESGTAAEFVFTLYILCKEEPSHKIELKTGKLISILDDPNGNSYVSHTSIGFIIHDLNP